MRDLCWWNVYVGELCLFFRVFRHAAGFAKKNVCNDFRFRLCYFFSGHTFLSSWKSTLFSHKQIMDNKIIISILTVLKHCLFARICCFGHRCTAAFYFSNSVGVDSSVRNDAL